MFPMPSFGRHRPNEPELYGIFYQPSISGTNLSFVVNGIDVVSGSVVVVGISWFPGSRGKFRRWRIQQKMHIVGFGLILDVLFAER